MRLSLSTMLALVVASDWMYVFSIATAELSRGFISSNYNDAIRNVEVIKFYYVVADRLINDL